MEESTCNVGSSRSTAGEKNLSARSSFVKHRKWVRVGRGGEGVGRDSGKGRQPRKGGLLSQQLNVHGK